MFFAIQTLLLLVVSCSIDIVSFTFVYNVIIRVSAHAIFQDKIFETFSALISTSLNTVFCSWNQLTSVVLKEVIVLTSNAFVDIFVLGAVGNIFSQFTRVEFSEQKCFVVAFKTDVFDSRMIDFTRRNDIMRQTSSILQVVLVVTNGTKRSISLVHFTKFSISFTAKILVFIVVKSITAHLASQLSSQVVRRFVDLTICNGLKTLTFVISQSEGVETFFTSFRNSTQFLTIFNFFFISWNTVVQADQKMSFFTTNTIRIHWLTGILQTMLYGFDFNTIVLIVEPESLHTFRTSGQRAVLFAVQNCIFRILFALTIYSEKITSTANFTKIESFEFKTIIYFVLNTSRKFFGVNDFVLKIVVVEEKVLLLFGSGQSQQTRQVRIGVVNVAGFARVTLDVFVSGTVDIFGIGRAGFLVYWKHVLRSTLQTNLLWIFNCTIFYWSCDFFTLCIFQEKSRFTIGTRIGRVVSVTILNNILTENFNALFGRQIQMIILWTLQTSSEVVCKFTIVQGEFFAFLADQSEPVLKITILASLLDAFQTSIRTLRVYRDC